MINTDFKDVNNQSIPMGLRWRPFYASPTVKVDNGVTDHSESTPSVRVFIGTDGHNSNLDDFEENIDQDIFLSYVDTNPKGICAQENHHLEWFVELEESHRITTPAFGAADRVYFGTNASRNLYSCAANGSSEEEQGKLNVFDFEGVEVMSNQVGNVDFHPLVTDEHIYLMLPSGLQSFGSGVYNNRLNSNSDIVVKMKSWELVN